MAKKFPPPSTAEEEEEEVREAAYTTLSKLALEEDILEKNTNLKQLNAKQWCVSISNPLSRPFPHLTAGIEQQETSTTLSALLKKENCFLNKFLHILREIALPCPPLPDRDWGCLGLLLLFLPPLPPQPRGDLPVELAVSDEVAHLVELEEN